jgi:hypothetical protein
LHNNIADFLDSVCDLDFVEIVRQGQAEAAEIDRELYPGRGRRGLPKGMQDQAARLRRQLGNFLFFMQSGVRPADASSDEFALYRPLCERLVKKGQFKPSVLDLFDRPAGT